MRHGRLLDPFLEAASLSWVSSPEQDTQNDPRGCFLTRTLCREGETRGRKGSALPTSDILGLGGFILLEKALPWVHGSWLTRVTPRGRQKRVSGGWNPRLRPPALFCPFGVWERVGGICTASSFVTLGTQYSGGSSSPSIQPGTSRWWLCLRLREVGELAQRVPRTVPTM